MLARTILVGSEQVLTQLRTWKPLFKLTTHSAFFRNMTDQEENTYTSSVVNINFDFSMKNRFHFKMKREFGNQKRMAEMTGRKVVFLTFNNRQQHLGQREDFSPPQKTTKRRANIESFLKANEN